ncbi:hypothetical protein I553_0618 [Mycobacterium xenopi 4042]|uniref:Uncharacterized protein n=1 Tax=Mycobacterium xenopi 4042 TaxID=1299334 RepID=X7YKL1_MYCXE|nr:hypothetical protein I553_0618 [Mycobacterium xenopi 4042]
MATDNAAARQRISISAAPLGVRTAATDPVRGRRTRAHARRMAGAWLPAGGHHRGRMRGSCAPAAAASARRCVDHDGPVLRRA